MDPDQQLRNLRDFLLVYNRMTEICFQRCSSNFNYRNLTMDEDRCLDNCAGKLIRSNHRLMGTYVQLMPKMVQRRMEEMETKMAENAKAAEAVAAAAAAPAAETSSLPPEVPPTLPPPTVADVGPGLEIPVALDAAISNPTTATDVKLSAATAVTPATDVAHPSVLGDTIKGPFHTASLPQPQSQIAGAQIEFESSAPLSASMPSNTTASSADLPASAAAAAPAVPQSVENLSGPGLPPPSGH